MSVFQIENEQVILDADGKPEYVVLPIARYEHLLALLEDYGLGQAIAEAEDAPRYNLQDALALLSSNN